ncbi:MAG: cupin domain-containing protein, partial [Christensenellales bacterium]
MSVIKNIPHRQILLLADQIDTLQGQIVSRTLCQNDAVSVTLFAFSQGEEIASHVSEGDALVYVLQGSAKLTVGDEEFICTQGQSLVMTSR